MAKLCAKGKAAAKRKFKVYPSAYANMYASGVCSGKITPGGKRQKKAEGGLIDNKNKKKKETEKKETAVGKAKKILTLKQKRLEDLRKELGMKKGGIVTGCGKVMSNRRKKTKYI